MKKLLILVCLGGLLFAGDFEDNLKKSIKANFGQDVEIISSDKLKSINGLHLTVIKIDSGAIPFYVSEDGKSLLAISEPFLFAHESDKDLLTQRISDINKINSSAKNKLVDDIFDKVPKEAGILLKSKNKTDELLTIVTDPDCPYCRNELANLNEHLKTTNVRIIFSPVHDETAFIKSALILEETKKLKDNEKIISVMQKYYQDVTLDEKQQQTKTDIVHQAANTIFGSGLIRSVPYLHSGKLK
ncbi:MAG: hypothetical protein LBC08_00730 [Campylobacteraceae bacterium]|jgi:thiol:disulfide interchange protein DsbC|nr:hypothetical protein [Campylobacteraceae bacterium]